MLVGKRVVLEDIDPDNIEWMRQQRNMSEMRQYFREWKDISKDQQEAWYKSRGNNSDPNHVYFQIMAIPEKNGSGVLELPTKHNMLYGQLDAKKQRELAVSERCVIGACGLHYIDWRLRSAEFGIFISKEARCLGLGKEALLMLCNYGFREVNLHKIFAEVYDNNKALGLYTSVGFSTDGVFRDNYFCDGKYGNSHLISVLEDEWFRLHDKR
jgi:RimJ/RimL family protein N-acetyltransferase